MIVVGSRCKTYKNHGLPTCRTTSTVGGHGAGRAAKYPCEDTGHYFAEKENGQSNILCLPACIMPGSLGILAGIAPCTRSRLQGFGLSACASAVYCSLPEVCLHLVGREQANMLGNIAATGIDGYSFASWELFWGLSFSDLLAVIFFEGFALAVAIKLKCLVGMAGQRVGEASNPGPAGAAATRRKRKQRQQAQQAQQGAQLQQVLQMMMTIIQVLVPLLRAKGQDVPDFSTLTSALQAQLGGNVARSSGDTRRSTPRSQPTSRASPSATQTDPPETPPPRRTVFVKEPEVVEIPAVGASKPVPKRSAMRRETKLPPTAPHGSSASLRLLHRHRLHTLCAVMIGTVRLSRTRTSFQAWPTPRRGVSFSWPKTLSRQMLRSSSCGKVVQHMLVGFWCAMWKGIFRSP